MKQSESSEHEQTSSVQTIVLSSRQPALPHPSSSKVRTSVRVGTALPTSIFLLIQRDTPTERAARDVVAIISTQKITPKSPVAVFNKLIHVATTMLASHGKSDTTIDLASGTVHAAYGTVFIFQATASNICTYESALFSAARATPSKQQQKQGKSQALAGSPRCTPHH